MALGRWEIKKRLRFGALSEIAVATDRTLGHVSQVVSGLRRDRKVEVAVARRLRMKVEDVFAPKDSEAAA